MADWIDAGRVKILPKGVWNAETPYEVDDIVTYHHYAYICIKDNIGVRPQDSQTSEYWEEFGNAVDGDNETIVINEGIISGIDYVKKTYVDTELEKKQNTLVPGKNISIDEDTNEISAKGGTWSDIEQKPFTRVGENLSVDENGALNAETGGGTASEITYDNSTSGMTATNVQDAIDEQKQDLTQISNTISDEWVSGKSYAIGDICIYNNKLWKCLVANNVTPSESANWTRINLADTKMQIDKYSSGNTYATFQTDSNNRILIGKLDANTNYAQFIINGKDYGYIKFDVSRNIGVNP